MPDPVTLSSCDEEIPLLAVTRQFDFGQFIQLYDAGIDANNPQAPPKPMPIVLDPAGRLLREAVTTAAKSAAMIADGQANASNGQAYASEAELLGGVSLERLLAEEPPEEGGDRVTRVEVKDLPRLLDTGAVTEDGVRYEVEVNSLLASALFQGRPALVRALVRGDDGAPAAKIVQLTPVIPEVELTSSGVNRLLAEGEVETDDRELQVALEAGTVRALLSGRETVARLTGDAAPAGLVRLIPPTVERRPAATSVTVSDLAAFLARPEVPGTDGRPLRLPLTPETIDQLREHHAASVETDGVTVTVDVVQSASYAATRLNGGDSYPNGDEEPGEEPPAEEPEEEASTTTGGPTVSAGTGGDQEYGVMEIFPESRVDISSKYHTFHTAGTQDGRGLLDAVEPRLPVGRGIKVAVFVPWRQTWELIGFSRGNLLHTLALAPQEQVVIEVSSWERRSRSLEQSTETEVDQTFETVQTTKDTEDIFRELTTRHDFAWQIQGSVDASYNNGVAAINVQAGGGVQNTDGIEKVARDTFSHLEESTMKAAAKVRSRRVTRITETVETGISERVTRQVQNPNLCHTLTLDFFETLAHYDIKTAFQPDRLRLVALIRNPITVEEFTRELVRRNETALRLALLDPALASGFEACRMIDSYEKAADLLEKQAADAKKTREATEAERPPPAQPPSAPPPSAQEAAVIEVVKQIGTAAKTIKDNARIDPALQRIKAKSPVSQTDRRNGQYWMFIQLCAAKLPGLLDALNRVAGLTSPTVNDAQTVLSSFPGPGQPTSLDNLNELSDVDKERAGLSGAIRRYMAAEWDWAWWSGRCREESLYGANDAGLAGLAGRLREAVQAWEAKRTEGGLALEKDLAIKQAEGKQDQASMEDRLSMAFPLDALAQAQEREQALLAHLNDHRDHYCYALFQALGPSEQVSEILEASGNQLQVGLFEPRVVAMNGPWLAVPLSPIAASTLNTFVENLRNGLEATFDGAEGNPDRVVVPTPGVSVASRLGNCSTCEEFVEEGRRIELRRLRADANAARLETQRRKALLDAGDLEEFQAEEGGLNVRLEQPPSQ